MIIPFATMTHDPQCHAQGSTGKRRRKRYFQTSTTTTAQQASSRSDPRFPGCGWDRHRVLATLARCPTCKTCLYVLMEPPGASGVAACLRLFHTCCPVVHFASWRTDNGPEFKTRLNPSGPKGTLALVRVVRSTLLGSLYFTGAGFFFRLGRRESGGRGGSDRVENRRF